MRNKILSISRNSIPYVKELRKIPIVDSCSVAILMQQLDYWFDRMKEEQKTFYKFLQPCENFLYKEGDSWCEELGFSPYEFRTAFDAIGVRYNSVNEFKTAGKDEKIDIFGGKFYLSYMDKIKGITYYQRNNVFVDSILNALTSGEIQSYLDFFAIYAELYPQFKASNILSLENYERIKKQSAGKDSKSTEVKNLHLRKLRTFIYGNKEPSFTEMENLYPEYTDTTTDTTTNNTSNKKREQAPPSLKNENSFFSENEKEKESNSDVNSHYSTDSKINNEGGAKFDVATLILDLEQKAETFYLGKFDKSTAKHKELISNSQLNHDLSRFKDFCVNMYQNMIAAQKINPAAISATNFASDENFEIVMQGRGKKGVLNSFNYKEIPTLPTSLKGFEKAFKGWYQKKLENEGAKMSRTAVLAQIAKLESLPIEFLKEENVIGDANENSWKCIIYDDKKLDAWKKFSQPKQNKQFQQPAQDLPQYTERDRKEIAAMFRYYEQGKQRDVEDMVIMLGCRGIDGAQLIREKYGIGQS